MERKYTFEQIASDFRLWGEYFDTGANMTESEFEGLSVEEKVEMLAQAFSR